MIASALPRVVVRDDLRRSRLTTLLRLFLALPHLLWLALWGSGMVLLLPVMWGITLVKGRPNPGLHEVYAMYLRYTLHVYAFATLAAEPFPGFLGNAPYPVDVVVPPPERQNRWSVGLRLFLALPPYVLAGALGSGVVTSAGTTWSIGIGVLPIAALCAWFAILVRGRLTAGLRDLMVYALGYALQTAAFFFLVTGAYPTSDPRAVPLDPRPEHPVSLTNADDPHRHRLLVAFRLVLLAPHFVWAALWSLAVVLAAPVAWIAALARGRPPAPLHRFFAAFTRYTAHLNAFAYLAGGPFPGFTGAAGTYPVDLDLAAPAARQSRWSIGFRWLLAVPALLIAGALGTAMTTAAVGAWCFALATGRMPAGLQRLNAYGVRYTGQTYAYALLVTERYPHSSPSEDEHPGGDPLFFAPERPTLAVAA